jgi:hypothetical protein
MGGKASTDAIPTDCHLLPTRLQQEISAASHASHRIGAPSTAVRLTDIA